MMMTEKLDTTVIIEPSAHKQVWIQLEPSVPHTACNQFIVIPDFLYYLSTQSDCCHDVIELDEESIHLLVSGYKPPLAAALTNGHS